MFKSTHLLLINFVLLTLLCGCSDSSPAKSDMQTQILNQLAPCPEFSIANFQKVNGFLQPDGSYVEVLNFDIVYTPPDQVVKDIGEYDLKKQALLASGDSAAAYPQEPVGPIDMPVATLDGQERTLITNDFSQDCPMLSNEYSSFNMFNIRAFDNYGKAQTVSYSNMTYHFVKSDNGWVLTY